jgi:MFS family permease
MASALHSVQLPVRWLFWWRRCSSLSSPDCRSQLLLQRGQLTSASSSGLYSGSSSHSTLSKGLAISYRQTICPHTQRSLGLNAQFGSLLIVMVNAASVMGFFLLGLLMGRSSVSSVILAISVGAAAAILVVWGVSTSIGPLFLFSVLYGLTAGSYSTSWTGMIRDIKERSLAADASIVFGFLAAGRGK